MYIKNCLFVLLCLETSLLLHLFLFSPKETSTISQFYRRRWNRVLAFDSLRCHQWRWGSFGAVGLTVFGLRCPINIIFRPDLLWYQYHWNDILVYCFIMLGTFSTTLLLYFFFSNWKQWIAGWTALSSPVTSLVVMATTCDATGGVWGR